MKKHKFAQVSGNLQLLRVDESVGKKVITVGIVSDRTDSYNTVIKPDGLITPAESILIDYNHNRISTGAKVVDKGVQKVNITIGGVKQEIESRVFEIHVLKKHRAWTRENKDKRDSEVKSIVELIENGRINWVSVDFSPVDTETEYVYDKDGNVKRVVYNKWRLNYLSLLDVKPGQDDSYFLNVRMNFNLLNNTSMFKNIKGLRAAIVSSLTEVLNQRKLEGEVSNVNLIMDSEEAGSVRFILGESEYELDYTLEEESVRFAEELVNLREGEDDEEEDAGDEGGSEDDEEAPKGEDEDSDGDEGKRDGEESGEGDEAGDDEEEEEGEQRMSVGAAVKQTSTGKLGIVKGINITESDTGTQSTVTIEMLSGETVTVDKKKTGYSMNSDGDREFIYADNGDILMALKDMLKSAPQEEQRYLVQEKDAEIEKLNNKIREQQKLINSPNLRSGSETGTVDMDGDQRGQDSKKSEDSEKIKNLRAGLVKQAYNG